MRFEWGAAGVREVAADAAVIVWVDVLGDGEAFPNLQGPRSGASVIAGSLRNRTAVAEWVTRHQNLKGDRVSVAVIAAGGVHEDGSIRFSVEDFLAAGAIIDALAAEGHDYSSPEAAAACAAFTGLRGAVGHLISASTSGRYLAASEGAAQLQKATAMDSSAEVVVLGE